MQTALIQHVAANPIPAVRAVQKPCSAEHCRKGCRNLQRLQIRASERGSLSRYGSMEPAKPEVIPVEALARRPGVQCCCRSVLAMLQLLQIGSVDLCTASAHTTDTSEATSRADLVGTAPKPKRQRLEHDSTDSESQDSVFHEDAFDALQPQQAGSLQDEAASLTQEQLLLRRLDHLAQLTKIYKVSLHGPCSGALDHRRKHLSAELLGVCLAFTRQLLGMDRASEQVCLLLHSGGVLGCGRRAEDAAPALQHQSAAWGGRCGQHQHQPGYVLSCALTYFLQQLLQCRFNCIICSLPHAGRAALMLCWVCTNAYVMRSAAGRQAAIPQRQEQLHRGGSPRATVC